MVQCAADVVVLSFLNEAVHEGALTLVPADRVIVPWGAVAADTLTAITVRPTTLVPGVGARNTTLVRSVGMLSE